MTKPQSASLSKFLKSVGPLNYRSHHRFLLIGVIGRALWIKRRRLTESALGYRLVVADYSQIELRAAAERSGDRRMIEAYQNDEDLHRLTAALIADKSLDQVEKSERQAAKAINFGLIYAMGAKAEYAYNNFHCRSCGSNLSR